MKKLFLYAAALLAAISFSACSDDDETSLPATPENIAGTWMVTHTIGWDINEGEKRTFEEYYSEDGWYKTLTFDKDGSVIEDVISNGEVVETEKGSYSISGKELKINYYDDTRFEIRMLTQSQLVMIESPTDGDEYFDYEYTATLKRIE